MRTLELNKTRLWMVTPSGETDVKDADGFLTGEKVKTYTAPVEIRINIFPSNGDIEQRIFGKQESFDMVAISNEIKLDSNTLLFLNTPVSNYDRTYDFRVDSIKESLNTFNYGLRRKV